MRKDTESQSELVIIKKYANRRLYNTDTSTYVTLDDLAEMVRRERDFVVYDAKTREDLTHSVLTQIIVEQESKGQNLLPVGFLRQLIRFYGDSVGRLVPSYLELSLNTLTEQQEKYRSQFSNAFGAPALEAMHEQTKQNMEMFEKALSMFTPFPQTDQTPEAGGKVSKNKGQDNGAAKNEIAAFKEQLTEMQSKLDKLSDE